MAKKKQKNSLLIVLIILLVGISVGYAAFSQTLTITGTATANGNFKLEFDNYSMTTENGASGSTVSKETSGDLTFSAILNYPGAYSNFSTDIKNTGSIAAKVTSIDITYGSDNKTLTFANGSKSANLTNDIKLTLDYPDVNDTIANGSTKSNAVTFKIEWIDSSTNTTNTTQNTPNPTSINFTVKLNYVQDGASTVTNTTNTI